MHGMLAISDPMSSGVMISKADVREVNQLVNMSLESEPQG